MKRITWDVASGEKLHVFGGHTAEVTSVAFSPDGRTALSASVDTTLILWRIDNLEELIQWTYQHRYVRDLTCEERALYHIEPGCDAKGVFPTRTPYPTPAPGQ